MAWVVDLLVVGLIEGEVVEGGARNGFPLDVSGGWCWRLAGLLPALDPRPGLGTGAHEADRLIAGLDDVAVVRKAVEQRRGHLRVAEHGRPFAEVQVGRDHHAGVFVELAQQVEQQGPAGLAERQVAELVEDDQVHAQQAGGDPAGLALGLLLLQRIDQIDRRVKAHALAMARDRGDADRGGQVRLAGAWSADQDGVVRDVHERGLGQRRHQLAIDRRDAEVEAGQIAVHGELRRVHLPVHRAHGAVRDLGLEQVFQQPSCAVSAAAGALLDQVDPRAGHAVQTQLLEFDAEVTHGRLPRQRCATGRSVLCRRWAACSPARSSPRSSAAVRRSAAPAR